MMAAGPCLRKSRLAACLIFFFTATPPPAIYPLSLHDALPIFCPPSKYARKRSPWRAYWPLRPRPQRSEEHTTEHQSQPNFVCPLQPEKKKPPVRPAFL